ncbi:MAG: aminotransferase class IV [Polyangiales bacterium]
MQALVSVDGRPLPPSDAHVSVFDRGLLHGDGVFEVLRTYAGRPFALEEHLSRLQSSAAIIDLTLPVSPAQLRAEVESLVAAAPWPESSVRVVVTRGDGPPGVELDPAMRPRRVVTVTPLPTPSASLYRDGARAVTVREARRCDPDPRSLWRAKTLSWLPSLVALRKARAAGAYEAIRVGDDGAVFEAATANVFFVESGALHTPSLDCGILPGITRELILSAARARGVAVVEARLSTASLWTADEVFVTASLREVVPVVRVDDHEVGEGSPGPLTRAMHRALRDIVGAPSP